VVGVGVCGTGGTAVSVCGPGGVGGVTEVDVGPGGTGGVTTVGRTGAGGVGGVPLPLQSAGQVEALSALHDPT